MNLPRDKALINIVALVHDDATEFHGAQIDDLIEIQVSRR